MLKGRQNSAIKFIYILIITLLIFVTYRIYVTDFFVMLLGMKNFEIPEVIKLLFPYSMVNTLVFFLAVWYVNKEAYNLPVNKWEKGLSVLFSLLFLAGFNITTTGAFAENMYSNRMLLFYVVFFAGMYYIFRFALMHVRRILKYIKCSRINYYFSEKKQFIIFAILIFICWIPFVVLRYPAGFEYDAYHQIADFLDGTMTNHWPVASSVSMGIFVWAGQALFGSADAGIFCYCIIQSIIGSLIFSYAALVMRRLSIPALYTYISVVIFAIIPNYPGYITSAVKDAPFAYMILLFTLYLTQDILLDQSKNAVLIGITGFIFCILRNNGIYLIYGLILAIVITSLVQKKLFKKSLLISLFSCALLFLLYSRAFLPAINIQGTSEAEALSVPFQQTARLANKRKDSISESEADIINRVLNLDVIQKEYDQGLSDPVKGTYHSNSISDLTSYFGVWAKEGLRNPDIYIDAFFHNSIGFIYPDIRMGNSPVVSGMYGQVWNDRNIQFTYTDDMYRTREQIKENVSAFENTPLVFPFVNIAIQLWIPIVSFMWALNKRDRKLLFLLIPSLLGILICLASPTYMNNGARYALPVIYTNLLLIGATLIEDCERKNSNV